MQHARTQKDTPFMLPSLSLSLSFIYIYIPPEQHITPQYCTFVNNSSNLPLYIGHIHSSVLEAPNTKTNSLCVQTNLAIKLFWFSLSLSLSVNLMKSKLDPEGLGIILLGQFLQEFFPDQVINIDHVSLFQID